MAAIVTRIGHEDLVDDSGTTLTGSSAATNLPVTNLKDNFVAVPWRTTGDTDENVVIDFGSAKQVTAVGIFGHNLTSGATVTLQGNASDSWGTPTYSQALTIVTDSLSDVIPKICFFLDQTFRYFRLRLQDASNPDTYIEIGRLWMGAYVTPTYNFDQGYTVEIVKPDQIDRPDVGGQYGRQLPSYEVVSFGWSASGNPLPEADRLTMEAIYRKLGLTSPILFVYDALNNPSKSAIYGYFDNGRLVRKHGGVTDYGTEGLTIREEVGWSYV